MCKQRPTIKDVRTVKVCSRLTESDEKLRVGSVINSDSSPLGDAGLLLRGVVRGNSTRMGCTSWLPGKLQILSAQRTVALSTSQDACKDRLQLTLETACLSCRDLYRASAALSPARAYADFDTTL